MIGVSAPVRRVVLKSERGNGEFFATTSAFVATTDRVVANRF